MGFSTSRNYLQVITQLFNISPLVTISENKIMRQYLITTIVFPETSTNNVTISSVSRAPPLPSDLGCNWMKLRPTFCNSGQVMFVSTTSLEIGRKVGLIPGPYLSPDLTHMTFFSEVIRKTKYSVSYTGICQSTCQKLVMRLQIFLEKHFEACSKTLDTDLCL